MPLQDPYQQSNTGLQGHIMTSQWVGCSVSSRHTRRMISTWRTQGRARRRCRGIVGRLSFMMMIDVGLILLESVSGVGEDTHLLFSICLSVSTVCMASTSMSTIPHTSICLISCMHASLAFSLNWSIVPCLIGRIQRKRCLAWFGLHGWSIIGIC